VRIFNTIKICQKSLLGDGVVQWAGIPQLYIQDIDLHSYRPSQAAEMGKMEIVEPRILHCIF